MDFLVSSLVFLLVYAILFIVYFIKRKKITLPFLILVLGFLTLNILIFTKNLLILLYFLIFIGFSNFIRYNDQNEEDVIYFDYRENKFYSVSLIVNKILSLVKNTNLLLGSIVTTSKYSIKYNRKPLYLNEQILSGGVLISGSTGSGKSTLMKSIMAQEIKKKPVWFVEYKGDLELVEYLKEVASKENVPIYIFSMDECNFTFNLMKYLNETGKVEALLNTRKWQLSGNDEHYKTSYQLLLQKVIRDYEIYRTNMNEQVNYLLGLYTYLIKEGKSYQTEKDGFNTLIKQLELIITSKAKDLLIEKDLTLDLNTDDRYIAVFSFPSSNKALASSLSSILFQDIMDRGTRNPFKNKLLLMVDEFGTLENSQLIKDLLEKGRSCGIQTLFSILDINQIVSTSGMPFVQGILGTINTFILLNGSTVQTAELMGGVSKHEVEGDIMSLEKPTKNKPPTALLISKYRIYSKYGIGSQEVHKFIPYIHKLEGNKIKTNGTPTIIELKNINESRIEIDEKIDIIDDIDKFI